MCAEIAQVTKAYSSSSPEQLSLESGQLILIFSKNPSGWWLGELQVCDNYISNIFKYSSTLLTDKRATSVFVDQ